MLNFYRYGQRLVKKITHKKAMRFSSAKVQLIERLPVNNVDACYLSFSIDISVLAGGFWWEGSAGTRKGLGLLRIPPIDLTSKALDKLVQGLGSSYLRVGGSEADNIHYFTDTDNKDDLVLSKAIWDSLHGFIHRNNLKFMFTFKYGLFKRDTQGEWCGGEVERLLAYSRENNYRLDVCELGNELNAYWAFHGLRAQPRALDLAKDYGTFYRWVKKYYPQVKISGPGSAFWPHLGETIKPFSDITEKFLAHINFPIDIVDWHYYPFQSKRSPVRTRLATQRRALSVRSFNYFYKYSERIKAYRDKYQPSAEVWLTETGSAQCGGQKKISDRFASCFWWAEQLAAGAKLGQKVMIRQSLIGGEYGLINRLTLKPRPDYWLSWLWVRLMGTAVYAVACANPRVRAYCHGQAEGTGRTLLLVNLQAESVAINTEAFGVFEKSYELSARKLSAKKVRINDMKPKITKALSDFDKPESKFQPVALKPYTINFWCFKKDG